MSADQSKTSAQTVQCAPGCCVAGHVGAEDVQIQHWHRKVAEFEGKIELWNELTKRWAIPHIGFIQPYKFCVSCGQPVNHAKHSPASLIGDLVETLRSASDSTAVLNHLPVDLQQALRESLKRGETWLALQRGDRDG